MPSVAFALPLLPGKEVDDRAGLLRYTEGEDRDAYFASRRALGITREAVWHQTTPNGMLAVILIEADDLDRALQGTSQSQEPVDVAFRSFVKDVHGLDLANEPPPEISQVVDNRF